MSSSSSFLEDYDSAKDTLRRLYDSRLRLAILDALKGGPMRLSDLRRAVGANAPNTSSKAKNLEEIGLVERSGDYKLTSYGLITRELIHETLAFCSVFENFKEYWDTHAVEAIPEEFLKRLGELKGLKLVKVSRSNANAPFEILFKNIMDAREKFYGLCPIYYKNWTELPIPLSKKRIDTQLILSEPIFKESTKILTKDIVEKFDKHSQLYETKEKGSLPAFMSTEKFFVLALESKTAPSIYLDAMLISTHPSAIKWGLDLFEHYKKRARPVKLADYL